MARGPRHGPHPPRPPAARTSAHSDLLFRESSYSYHVSVVLLGHMASSGLLHSIRRKVFRHTSFFQAEVLTLCVKYVFFFFFFSINSRFSVLIRTNFNIPMFMQRSVWGDTSMGNTRSYCETESTGNERS